MVEQVYVCLNCSFGHQNSCIKSFTDATGYDLINSMLGVGLSVTSVFYYRYNL